jgi:hypothetical protein
MSKCAALVVAAVLSLPFTGASPGSARAAQPSAVTPWIQLERTAIAAQRLTPPRASRALAHVSSAMYLAALAGTEARDDAVSGAASTVLAYFFPDQAAQIDALGDRLAEADSGAFRRGSLIGRLLIVRAEHDGAGVVWTGTSPQGAGYWIPTPPGFQYPPLEPLAGTWRTWNLENGSQFRPDPPPAYASPRFLAETNEVYAVSQTRARPAHRTGRPPRLPRAAGAVTKPARMGRGPAPDSPLREARDA